ncbi:MAG: hypothetical protein H6652_00120 [Ardenticatenaceae bacterium]|nr:hypothetical protein [Ardenticatenaceae bacterium]
MTIDILNTLADLKPHYRGSLFLTYTLDLVFFEELVAPKLDALGCTNIVILADQHGYDEAQERGHRHLRRVGRQYVCAPIVSPSRGVQHVKVIMLVGPEHGLLLIGSGNLTLHGIGRNLEQFVRFDLNLAEATEGDPSARYAFATVWQLIQEMSEGTGVASTAVERISAIGELAPWLADTSPTPPSDMRLWHSYNRSIYAQWFDRAPIQEMRLLSPFWTVEAIDRLVQRFTPQMLVLGLNESEHRLDAEALQRRSQEWACELQLFTVSGLLNEQRRLHAKTFVGKNSEGAWCLLGSANCTVPGLVQSWQEGGNLELVVWQKSSNPTAFDAIWSDDILSIVALNPADIRPGEPEDEPTSKSLPFRLLELILDNEELTGQIMWQEGNAYQNEGKWLLELRQANIRLPITPDAQGEFSLPFPETLPKTESGRVIWSTVGQPEVASPYHWIDQPAELHRFGNRTYHARIKASLQTFAGAGSLFEELLNFLWDRVDPRQVQAEAEKEKDGQGRGKRSGKNQMKEDDTPAPPASSFITDEELTYTLIRHAEGYAPHNQSVHSLRDLLSLALLRLTVETKPAEVEVDDAGDRDEYQNSEEEIQQKAEKKKVLKQLCDSVLRYCQRYARQLNKAEYLTQVGPRLLFENHYTLGRILLEFYEKVQLFTEKDLRRCLLLIYGGLFWSKAADLQGKSGWDVFLDAGVEAVQLQEFWQAANMPLLTAVLVTHAWEKPKRWSDMIHRPQAVQRFMVARELVNHIEKTTSERFWRTIDSSATDSQNIFGFRNLVELSAKGQPISVETIQDGIGTLADYRTPAQEKYKYLLHWWAYQQKRQSNTGSMAKLAQAIIDLGYKQELSLVRQLGKNGKLKPLQGEQDICPNCFVKLPDNVLFELRQYELKLCPVCSQAALYWEPTIGQDKSILSYI